MSRLQLSTISTHLWMDYKAKRGHLGSINQYQQSHNDTIDLSYGVPVFLAFWSGVVQKQLNQRIAHLILTYITHNVIP